MQGGYSWKIFRPGLDWSISALAGLFIFTLLAAVYGAGWERMTESVGPQGRGFNSLTAFAAQGLSGGKILKGGKEHPWDRKPKQGK